MHTRIKTLSFSLLLRAILPPLFIFSWPFSTAQAQPAQEKIEAQGDLKLGTPQTRTLALGTIHQWLLTLEKGHFAAVEVAENSINVVIRRVTPRGTRRVQFSNPTDSWKTEKATWIADTTGVWKVEIAPAKSVTKAGEYEIKWVIRRVATATDWQATAVDSLNDLALTYFGQNKHAEAELLFLRSIEIREKALGPDDLDLAESLHSLANLYQLQTKYEKAEPLYKRSMAIREKVLGPDHPEVAVSLQKLAMGYTLRGRFSEAEPLFKRSLAISEKALGPDHPRVADALNSLAALFYYQGKYAEVEALYKRALSIREKALGANDLAVAISLENLSLLYCIQGKFAEAEPLNKRSLAIREEVLGAEHPQVAESLSNLASLYVDQEKYAEAEPLFKQSLSIREKILGMEHPLVAATLNNLAVLYDRQKKYAEAEPLYVRSLAIREKADPLYVGQSINNLAALYVHLGKYAEAVPLYRRAVEMQEKSLGPNHPNVALRLKALARALFLQNEPQVETAMSLVERAIGILDASIGYPAERIDSYIMRAEMRKQQGNSAGALADLAEALRLAENLRPYASSSEEIRAGLFVKYAAYFDKIVRWELDARLPQTAFDYSERARAGVLFQAIQESEARIFADIPDSLLQKDRILRDQILALETEIQKAKYRSAKPDSLKVQKLENQYAVSVLAQDDLLKQLEQNYPRYYDLKYQTRAVAVADLQARLPDNATLLEYFVGDSALQIFVISKAQFQTFSPHTDTSFIPLVNAFYQAVRKADTPKYLTTAHELYKILIAPVAEYLTGKERLIIIPHGILYRVPFEALLTKPASKNKSPTPVDYRKLDYLVRHFDISYHYSASLYARSLQPQESPISRHAFLGFAPVFRSKETGGYMLASKELPILRKENDDAMRGIVVDGRKFSELHYSEDEVKSVITVFAKKAPQEPSLGYFHGQATEQNFKKDCGDYRVIHVATHSFINEEKPALSGIIFAQPTDSTATEDGVLYAGETYNLNLHADLVVLSSCESGLGKLIQGEGILAMTRGFLYSGASNLLFSLWKAPDKPTRDLMVAFYRQMLDGKNYAQALRQAKLKMMASQATAAPRLWSSFVLIGAE